MTSNTMDKKIIEKIRSSDYLPLLVESSAIINSTLDLNNVLECILRSAIKVTDSEGSSIIMLDEITGSLFFKCSIGKKNIAAMNIKMDKNQDSVAGWVVIKGKPVIINDAYNDSRFFRGVDQVSGVTTRNLMGAPLRIGKKIIGVIEVVNRKSKVNYDQEDLNLLLVFANLATAAIENARLYEALKLENEGLRQEFITENPIIGFSSGIKNVLELLEKVAPGKSTVLLRGETGTGKELIAERIHKLSPRRDKPLIKVNCAALPETLLESELFGHERGSFTGAVARKLGKFELAHNGTIFLDEIGDLSLTIQIKLLRVLQEREFERVGGTQTIKVDVRLITATNKNLENDVAQGKFREDLFYRLNVIPIYIPPLRERREDIPHLANYFLKKYASEMGKNIKGFSKEAMAFLIDYNWTGNIRELENVIERIAVISNNKIIMPDDLPKELKSPVVTIDTKETLWDIEKVLIIKALNETNWNKSKAAKKLGISRSILRYRIEKYNIQKGLD